MRYRRGRSYNRREQFWSEDDRRNEQILLAEFEFHNRNTNIIGADVLNSIKERLKTESTIFWTDEVFAKHHIGFKIYKTVVRLTDKNGNEKSKREETFIRILEFNELIEFTPEVFNKTRAIAGMSMFLGYMPTSDQRDLLLQINYGDIKEGVKVTKALMTWEETVDELIKQKLLDWYEICSEWSEFSDDVKDLFGDSYVFQRPVYKVFRDGYMRNGGIYHIIEVIEKRIDNINYRIALVGAIGSYDASFKFRIVHEKDNDYNYIDKGAFYFPIPPYYYLPPHLGEITVDGETQVNRKLFSLMEQNLSSVLGEGERVVTPMVYNFYSERALKFDDIGYKERDPHQAAINAQYVNLLNEGKKIKFGDIIMTKDKIAMINEGFTLEFEEQFMDVTENFAQLRKALDVRDARYNFNVIFDRLLQLSTLRFVRPEYVREPAYKTFKETKFIVNDMPITVKKDGSRIKINGIFCRIADVYHVLSKVICYRDVNMYNKYLKDVSFIGIEWKMMIGAGIRLELHNPFYRIFTKRGNAIYDRVYMRFSLLWDAYSRSTVYLLLNNKKYKIRYKGKFKRHFNYPRRTLTMAALKNELYECIDGIDDSAILDIVSNAIEEAKIIQQRGAELVANTIKDINAEEAKVKIRGTEMVGFKVKGRITGSEYFIDKVKLDVYKYTDGSWNRRCVVDDSTKERIFEDKLANRLVNIHNEPKRIFTLFN